MSGARRRTFLVLHALGDFSQARRTSIHHSRFLERHEPENDFLYHDVDWPVSDALRAIDFDAVVLDATFLCARYHRPRARFEAIREKYAFLAERDCVRLAFPQDEYDHGEILDDWLHRMKVDSVWSVVWNGWDLFFARTGTIAEIHRALTGYVDDEDAKRALATTPRRMSARQVDVGYRARNLPAQFGRQGRLKVLLGEKFAAAAVGSGLRLDVSLRPEDVFLGDAWIRFLEDCRWQLGSEGGSSLWDPRGEIRDRIHDFCMANPSASFEEIESACFPGLDGERTFAAISPRLFEVAIAGSAQVMVRGSYLGALEPDRDYLLLEPDFSNLADVIARLRDHALAERMAKSCFESLIVPETWRYGGHARQVLQRVDALLERKRIPAGREKQFERKRRAHVAAVRKAHAADRRRAAILRAARSVRGVVPAPIRRWVRGFLPPDA